MLLQFSRGICRYISPLSQLLGSRSLCSNVAEDVVQQKGMSKAMKAYLERAREHEQLMKDEQNKYQIGKRHLANMMGENPETFTSEDVNNAIAYLFPSGLFEKKARPMMKPPEEIFPSQKAAEFDETGRPHHFLFYTLSPNFYKLQYDIVEHINECYKIESIMQRKNQQPDQNLQLQSSGFHWMDKESLEMLLVEKISDKQYSTFIDAMERLFILPYSFKVANFIMQYRKPLMSQSKTSEVPKPQYDDSGRAFVTTYNCSRKNAFGHVTVKSPGTGLVIINGQDIKYFEDIYCREQVCNYFTYN